MIKHVVMWRFKEFEGKSKMENIEEAMKLLNALPGKIDALASLETGLNFNESPAAADLVLITTHKDKSALETYQKHPEHQKVGGFIGKVTAERNVVDFEF